MVATERRAGTRPDIALAILVAAAPGCWGESEAHAGGAGPVPTPIDGAGSDFAEAVSGWNLLLYGAAAADTTAMAFGSGDHSVRVILRESIASADWGNAANVAGYVLPIVVAPSIWLAGLLLDERGVLGAGSAAIQSLASTAIVTVLLKWSTGRPYPLYGGDPRAPDVLQHPEYARAFSPFNLRGDWAWPSGHTAATTSIVAALAGWAPDCVAIPLIGYSISAAIGLGMIVGDRHWASDVVSGGIVGYAIGSSVGRSFRRRAVGDRSRGREIRLWPFAPGGVGAAVIGIW